MCHLILSLMKKWVFYPCLLMVFSVSLAQETTVELDTVVIEETHYVRFHGSGHRTRLSVDHRNNDQILADHLQNTSGLYLRQYGGEGQLSSLSFRGTTASQTTVTWNGIDINSQTLGQTDFSSIPNFALSSIEIHHGGSGSLFGSGSLGGAIQLQTAQNFDGLRMTSSHQVGSFGKWFSGVGFQLREGCLGINTKVYRNQINNDFPVQYRGEEYNQNNASSQVTGGLVGVHYRLASKHRLNTEIWFNEHDRELQPIIGDRRSEDHLLDRNLRMSLKHQVLIGSGFLETTLSQVQDWQTYNQASETNLSRTLSSIDYEQSLSDLRVRGGVNFQWASTDVRSYQSDTTQWKTDQYLLLTLEKARMNASLSIRKSWVQGINAPITPSVGITHEVLANERVAVSLRGVSSRSFRAPTLNDLFWEPGGNPELKPETGWTQEVGLIAKTEALGKLTLSGTFFHSTIEDMILWQPGGTELNDDGSINSFWYPQNVQKVKINGLEAALDWIVNIQLVRVALKANYSYNDSRNLTALDDLGRTRNTQLAYVPFHKISNGLQTDWKTWGLSIAHNLVGKRFTELSNESTIDGYQLWDTTLNKVFTGKRHEVRISTGVRNLFDKDYQNYELRATPGRNYWIKMTYTFSKPNNYEH